VLGKTREHRRSRTRPRAHVHHSIIVTCWHDCTNLRSRTAPHPHAHVLHLINVAYRHDCL